MKDDRVGPLIAAFLLGLPTLPFVGLLFFGPRHETMSPEIAAIAAGFDDLGGAPSPEAIAEIVSGRAVVLSHHVRRKIGTRMWILVERTLDLKLPAGYSLQANTDAWLDGVELRSRGERRHACAGSGRRTIVPSVQGEVAVNRAHSLSPGGKHTVRVRSELSLTNAVGAEIWSAIHNSEHSFEVALGLPFEQIVLVSRPELEPSVGIRPLPPTARVAGDERVYPRIEFTYDDLPMSVSCMVEVLDSTDRVIKRTEIFLPSRERGGTILPLSVPSLTAGLHTVTVRLTPEPRVALRLSARVMEIWGQPIEQAMTIEVR